MINTMSLHQSLHADEHNYLGRIISSLSLLKQPHKLDVQATSYKMKISVFSFVLFNGLVFARPQNNVGIFSSFSNFNPNTQTFSAGTKTQLSQTFSTSQDSFFLPLDSGLDGLFPGNSFGATGLAGLANKGFDAKSFLDPSLTLGGSFDVFFAGE